MKNNGIKYKGKKRLKFRHIYALILLVITGVLAWLVLDLLVLEPARNRGVVVHGSRMEGIQDLEEFWKTDTIAFASTLDEVDYVTIFWNTGPVVYINVRVQPGTELLDAHRAAETVGNYFIEISDGVARQYDLQFVVSYGVISYIDADGNRAGILIDNQNAVVRHTHEYHHGLVEYVLAWAERYPSDFNVTRASDNIDFFINSVIEVVGESGLAELRARVAAIEIVVEIVADTEDGADGAITQQLPRLPANIRQIDQSNISTFPNWGAWCNENSRIIWNP